MKRALLFSLLLLLTLPTIAQQATWIYYPGDFEVWLGNEVQNRRTERGTFFPPFWKMDSHYVLVEFSKKLTLTAPEEVELFVEGRYNVKLDGKLLFASPNRISIPAGTHTLNIKVHNQTHVPAIYVQGKSIHSDSSWSVTYEDKEWIDESGKASDTSTGTTYLQAGSWNFNAPDTPPSSFKLATTPMSPRKLTQETKGVLVDFGKETIGFIKLHQLKGTGTVKLFYGESPEEALDTQFCETLDQRTVVNTHPSDLLFDSKAFRYVYVELDKGIAYDSISMLYEYLPLEYKGSFRCNDPLINQIWDVSAYTMHLTTREFFVDGIKRDRWIWSGDAYQSYLMNYYLFFDSPSVSRTMLNLRGKDPVTSHVNTIMDYTFYWFMGIYDYLLYTGDTQFVKQFYPRMQSLMQYCLDRQNGNGMLEGLAGDWVFIDWADFKMSKKGEVSFEQILFCRSLETMALCAQLMNDTVNETRYQTLATNLRSTLFTAFWSDQQHAFIHNREQGVQSTQVTPYTNLFAVLFNYVNAKQTASIKQNVLLNPDALKITTPYMRFYELEALCTLNEQTHVLNEMRAYWGGMLKAGATSFWEKYNPTEQGTEQLAMYGRPYGKSLCHAWGASPIYLLGKYYLGVKPETNGYKTFSIRPQLGDLTWISGTVPTPKGVIKVYMDSKKITVSTQQGEGYLYFNSQQKPTTNCGTIEQTAPQTYRIRIDKPNKEYVILGKHV